MFSLNDNSRSILSREIYDNHVYFYLIAFVKYSCYISYITYKNIPKQKAEKEPHGGVKEVFYVIGHVKPRPKMSLLNKY